MPINVRGSGWQPINVRGTWLLLLLVTGPISCWQPINVRGSGSWLLLLLTGLISRWQPISALSSHVTAVAHVAIKGS